MTVQKAASHPDSRPGGIGIGANNIAQLHDIDARMIEAVVGVREDFEHHIMGLSQAVHEGLALSRWRPPIFAANQDEPGRSHRRRLTAG